ncbi:unnamed protein product [Rhizoctonia solani]|uniref:Protein kinase domain-containing protein n=1 Tax=Rhizoctonia solani TaxID=456999 RepID=A0A8H3CAY3_9AGAM|nr:unnamed protein product [Rhizoctonia solani]
MSYPNTKRPHSPSPHDSTPPAKRRAQSPEEGEVESASPQQAPQRDSNHRRQTDSYRPRYSRSPSRSPITRRHRLPPRPSSPPREWDRWPPQPARIPGRTRNPYLDVERHPDTHRPLDTPGAPIAEERVGIEQLEPSEEDRGRDRKRTAPPIDPKLNSAVEDTIARIEREANEAEAKRKEEVKERPKVLRLSPDQEMQAYGRKFVGTSQLRDYAILEKLGEGTFGEVHKATHTVTRKVVALKRILMHNEKEGLPVTALREIKILKMLSHPSVVTVCDMVVEASTREKKGSIYMVFPYMDHDLAGLLENPAVKFSPSQIKLYMRQLLEGTEYLHRNKILHRDLKAANLLINNQGSLQIADFGLARPYSTSNPGWDPRVSELPWDPSKGGPERGGGGARYTNCVVTRWYRPPELLMGEAHYGCAIDMWGVGCIMGEMWTRRPILCGSSDSDQLDKIWELCGTPDEASWPGWRELPAVPPIEQKLPNRVKLFFREGTSMDEAGVELVDRMLTLNPAKRITAFEALDHDWFWIEPLCCDPASLPKYVSSHEYDKRKHKAEANGGPGFGPGGPANGFGPGVPPNGFGPGGPPGGFGPGAGGPPNGFGPGGPNGFAPGGPPSGFGPGGPPNGFGPPGPGFGPGPNGFGPPAHGGRGQWGGGWDRGGRGGGGGGRGRNGGRARGGGGYGRGGHAHAHGGFAPPPPPPPQQHNFNEPTNFSGYSRHETGGAGLPPPLGTHSREHRQMRERNMNMRNNNNHGAGAGNRGGGGKVVGGGGGGGEGEFLPYG